MALSASGRIDRILSGKQIHPFDWVNLPLFYDPRPEEGTEYTNRLRDATKMAYVAANEMSYGLKFLFRPSAMSNGALAYELVNDCTDIQEKNILAFGYRRFGRQVKTTQNLKNTVAGSELMNRVILPNRETDFRAANKIESRFGDMAVVVPIEFENAPRTQKSNNALSQGASFQDWTFESWWGPRVIDASGHVLGGNKRYESRYLGIEDLMADLIQCGMLDKYREHVGSGKQFDVIDEEGRVVPLADRAWGRAKHIFERTEDNFATDLAVAVLVAQFQIDDWLRGKDKPIGFDAINMKNVHHTLARRGEAELARMDRLKEMMLPYIAEKCADIVPYLEDPNLKKYFEEKVIPAKGKFKDLDLEQVKKALFSEPILGDLNDSDLPKKAATAEKFDRAALNTKFSHKPAKRRSTDGHYFETSARLFEDDHFSRLSLWEQAALPFIIGAIESFRLPEEAPRSMFYIAEPKGGALAKEYMQERGIDWLKEAYSAEDQIDGDDNFAKQVIEPNKKQTPEDVAAIVRLGEVYNRGIRNIVSSNNFINIAEAAEKYRNFVAADGPQKLSPRARLALMMEWMDRNPEAIAVRKDWQVHHDEAQMVVRALQIATGLVKRPYNGGDYKMEMFSYDQDKKKLAKLNMYDLVMTLGKNVDDMLSMTPPPEAKEHYLAMARMIQILDMYADPGRMNYEYHKNPRTGATDKSEIIHWREVDPSLMGFWHDDPAKKAELIDFRDHIRRKLLNVGVLYFNENDLEGLHEDYKAAWNEAQGMDASERRRSYGDRQTYQRWEGPT